MKSETLKKNKPACTDWFNENAHQIDLLMNSSTPMLSWFKSHLICALSQNSDVFHSIIELCGGNGSLGYNILNKTLFPVEYTNVEYRTKLHDKARYKMSRFISAISLFATPDKPFIDNGIKVPQIDLNQYPADVYIEILGFQYLTKDRKKLIKKISDNCTTFVCFEKVKTRHFESNELLACQQLGKSIPQGEIVQDVTLANILCDNFEYVAKVVRAGNYIGFVASHDKSKADLLVKEFNSNKQLLKNKFNITPKMIKSFPEYQAKVNSSYSTQDWFQK